MTKAIFFILSAITFFYFTGLSDNYFAMAQECSEGKKDGKCINPGLSSSMRLRGRASVQQKVSQTAAPTPPTSAGTTAAPTIFPVKDYFATTKGVFSSAPVPVPVPVQQGGGQGGWNN